MAASSCLSMSSTPSCAPGKAEGAMDAGNLLKPMLARGELHCIGATTLDEYRKHIEKDAALRAPFPARPRGPADGRRHHLHPCGDRRSATKSITACGSRTRRS